MLKRKQDSVTVGQVEQIQLVSELNGKELELAMRRAELLQNNNLAR
jgi:hypothetical protein